MRNVDLRKVRWRNLSCKRLLPSANESALQLWLLLWIFQSTGENKGFQFTSILLIGKSGPKAHSPSATRSPSTSFHWRRRLASSYGLLQSTSCLPGFVNGPRPVLRLGGPWPCPRSSPQRPLDLEAVLLREPGGLDTWPHPAWSAGRAHLDKSLGREDERGQQELLPCNGLLHPSPQHRLPLDHHQRPLKGLGDWYLKHRLLHYSSSTAANEQVLTCKT